MKVNNELVRIVARKTYRSRVLHVENVKKKNLVSVFQLFTSIQSHSENLLTQIFHIDAIMNDK